MWPILAQHALEGRRVMSGTDRRQQGSRCRAQHVEDVQVVIGGAAEIREQQAAVIALLEADAIDFSSGLEARELILT